MNKTVNYKGKSLSYKTSGNGPAVVLLHGFGEDAFVWEQQQTFLENFFYLIVPDLPGSGTSAIIDDMSMDGLAESIYFILQKEQVAKCNMIGHSMGGYISLAFAEKHSSLLDGLGLFHSTAYADTEEKKDSRKKNIAFIEENDVISFLQTFVPNLYSSSIKKHQTPIIEKHINNVSYFTKAALVAYLQSMIERPDRRHVLQQNKMPVLFVLGREDKAIPFNDVLKLASLPDISYIHILESSGHMGMIEEPEKSTLILNNFLLKTI